MNKRLQNSLKTTIFLLIGILLFWLVYRNQPVDEIILQLKKANYSWLVLSMVLGLLSHISRALRWEMLLEPLGYKPRKNVLFYSVMIMYLTNYAIPRSGEVVRAGVVSKYEKISFTSLLGTIITERAIDFIMLFILTAIVLITKFGVFLQFLNNNEAVSERFYSIKNSLWLIIGFIAFSVAILAILIIFRKKIAKTKIYLKFQTTINNFINGLKSVGTVKNKLLFFGHTVFIWIMYFVMIYVSFQAFDFTKHLGLLTGLTVFVFASFGMVFPSPGGIGTFAFAAHASQMIMLIAIGFWSLFMVSKINSKDSQILNTKNTIQNENQQIISDY